MGSGCGSIGREVASYTSDSQFESSHQQILFIFNCISMRNWKDDNKEKEAVYLWPN